MREYKQECYSDFKVFSFNFEKPIPAGGGGLLIINEESDSKYANYLYNSHNKLHYEELNVTKIIHIFYHSFYLIFFLSNILFGKLLSNRRKRLKGTVQTFKPEQEPIRSLIMNNIQKKLFYAQYLQKSKKARLENCSFNYFNKSNEIRNNYSFGTLNYYPVSLDTKNNKLRFRSNDIVLLWKNFVEHYKYFGVDIYEQDFPCTFNFVNNSIFLQARFFNEPYQGVPYFPLCNKSSE